MRRVSKNADRGCNCLIQSSPGSSRCLWDISTPFEFALSSFSSCAIIHLDITLAHQLRACMYNQSPGGLCFLDLRTVTTLGCLTPVGLQQIISDGSAPRQMGPCPMPTQHCLANSAQPLSSPSYSKKAQLIVSLLHATWLPFGFLDLTRHPAATYTFAILPILHLARQFLSQHPEIATSAIPPSTPGCVRKIIMAMMLHPSNSHLPLEEVEPLPWPLVVVDGVCKEVVGILVYGVTKAGAAIWLLCTPRRCNGCRSCPILCDIAWRHGAIRDRLDGEVVMCAVADTVGTWIIFTLGPSRSRLYAVQCTAV